MDVSVRESNIDEMKERLLSIDTALNKITYLESALRVSGFSFEVKRFLYGELCLLYSEKGMFEKAARAQANKASLEITSKDRIESFIDAALLYAKIGKVDEADSMFNRAARDGDPNSIVRVKLARKNIYSTVAKELMDKGKKGGALKYYEKLYKMNLDDVERTMIKDKLVSLYKSLGMFREARMLEGV